ncbi:MAG: GGDEF domain-containing protein [Methyloversatilis sp.]|uniref:GGDEF domain-containing protein n=1 Tax=Methyloversatilis sp. TaxID=2569862 RepID=UPI00273773F5|nr:GGDEF domain-containing protein [Methyloversatilis sp.]MDP3871045.1 GGDEF domain-containing protein [Methyloversatilis sp.]
MSDAMQPLEIAREALRRLAMRQLQPTPENYRSLYHEIAGTKADDLFPERALKLVCSTLPRLNQSQIEFVERLESAVVSRSWSAISGSLVGLLRAQAAPQRKWTALLKDLFKQFERNHDSLTYAQKQMAIQQVLDSSSGELDALYARLSKLADNWESCESSDAPAAESHGHGIHKIVPALDNSDAALRDLFASTLEGVVGGLLISAPELRDEALALGQALRDVRDMGGVDDLASKLRNLVYRLNWVVDDQAEIRAGLLSLLDLLLKNIGELVLDDRWMRGQIDSLRALCDHPLTARELDEVERRLREVIERQGSLRGNIDDAKHQIKLMLAGFVEQLGSFTDATSGFGEKMEGYAETIAAADDIGSLQGVIAEVIAATHSMRATTEKSRAEVDNMRDRVRAAEAEIERLQVELEQTSEKMRHDPLTGALNRKGLEESYAKEVSRAARRGSLLCLAVLDIDNFKRLNDTYGHNTGDEALLHLVGTVRDCLRPHDTLSRYGGEEFVILLPETSVEDSVIVLQRLQRELTKRYFLANNDKLLITFSAGVTVVGHEEPQTSAIERADVAMYQAKATGKNRVVIAPEQPIAA